MADIIDQLEVNYHDYEVCDSSARADIATINGKFDDYATKTELNNYATKTELNNYATKTELGDYATVTALNTAITATATTAQTNLEAAVADLQESFQDGVDEIYDHVEAKGSTPASHSLEDVVDAIDAIPTGGGGSCYSMIPQEFPKQELQSGGCMISEISFISGSDTFVAHIIASENNSINLNFSGYQLYGSGVGTLSLIIDNTTTISNIASFDFDDNQYPSSDKYDIEPREVNYSFSYTLPTPLSIGYHTLSLKPVLTSGDYIEFFNAFFSIYGTNFTEVQNPGYYLLNNTFSNYYPPSNFVVPTNPIVYQLKINTSGCGAGMETVEDAMNTYYSNTFDSGVSYHMQGIYPYEDEEGYHEPSISDTVVYTNGKFIYDHSESRVFPGYSGEDVTVSEEHCFILPIKDLFQRIYPQIIIHGKMTYKGGNINSNANIRIAILERLNQSTIQFLTDQSYYRYLSSLEEDGEFMIAFDISSIPKDVTSFIGLYFTEMGSGDDPYTVEIDRIFGSYYDYNCDNN